MKVKEFIKLLESQDMDKEIFVYNTISGNRVKVNVDDIDWNIDDVLDINLIEVLE